MSVLIDTSVWIDHLKQTEPDLVRLLNQGLASTHPFVVGELACGSLRNREEIIRLLSGLPMLAKADDEEMLQFISVHQLYGKGLGLVDLHLLAACCIERCTIWTRDRRLRGVAEVMKVASPLV